MQEEYPSNSMSKKAAEETPPTQKKIISGEAVLRKPSTGAKIKNVLWGSHAKMAMGFVVTSVVLPAVRDLAEDAVTSFIRGMFNGPGERNTGPRRVGNSNYVNYSSYAKKEEAPKRVISDRGRATHNFDELVLSTRAEGDQILGNLQELIEQYGFAKVSDMYEMAGVSGSFADNKWGWSDISSARVRAINGGYLLEMPRTEASD